MYAGTLPANGNSVTRGGAAAARVAHNHEVAGSSPAPATRSSTQNTRPCSMTNPYSFTPVKSQILVYIFKDAQKQLR